MVTETTSGEGLMTCSRCPTRTNVTWSGMCPRCYREMYGTPIDGSGVITTPMGVPVPPDAAANENEACAAIVDELLGKGNRLSTLIRNRMAARAIAGLGSPSAGAAAAEGEKR